MEKIKKIVKAVLSVLASIWRGLTKGEEEQE